MTEYLQIHLVEKSGFGNAITETARMQLPKDTTFASLLEAMGLHDISSAHWDSGADRYVAGKFYFKDSGTVEPMSYYVTRDERIRKRESLYDLCQRVEKEFMAKIR